MRNEILSGGVYGFAILSFPILLTGDSISAIYFLLASILLAIIRWSTK